MFPGDEPDPRELLEQLIGRPSWQRDGLRVEHRANRWNPHGRSVTCLVRGECLAFALADATLQGVWAGLSERQRRLMRRQAA